MERQLTISSVALSTAGSIPSHQAKGYSWGAQPEHKGRADDGQSILANAAVLYQLAKASAINLAFSRISSTVS